MSWSNDYGRVWGCVNYSCDIYSIVRFGPMAPSAAFTVLTLEPTLANIGCSSPPDNFWMANSCSRILGLLDLPVASRTSYTLLQYAQACHSYRKWVGSDHFLGFWEALLIIEFSLGLRTGLSRLVPLGSLLSVADWLYCWSCFSNVLALSYNSSNVSLGFGIPTLHCHLGNNHWKNQPFNNGDTPYPLYLGRLF